MITLIQKTWTVTASAAITQDFYTSAIANGGWLESFSISKPTGTSNHLSNGAGITVKAANSSMTMFAATTTGASGSVVSYTPRLTVTNAANAPLGPATGAGMALGFPDKWPIGAGEAIRVTVASATAAGVPNVASADGVSFTMSFYISGN